MHLSLRYTLPLAGALLLAVQGTWASPDPSEIARLGKELTCMGAELSLIHI